jgi:hypothetical protein
VIFKGEATAPSWGRSWSALADFHHLSNVRILEMSRQDADKLFLLRMYKTAVPCHEGERYRQQWQVSYDSWFVDSTDAIQSIWHSDSDSAMSRARSIVLTQNRYSSCQFTGSSVLDRTKNRPQQFLARTVVGDFSVQSYQW